MVSIPGYDTNLFTHGISQADYDEASSTTRYRPLLNRAIAGQYAPGSTFKMVTATAGLQEGKITPATLLAARAISPTAAGSITTGPSYNLGYMNVAKALARLVRHVLLPGRRNGRRRHARPLRARVRFRHARRTSRCPACSPGWCPIASGRQLACGVPDLNSDACRWTLGDTVTFGIGQSALLTTPLNQAVYVAALANGGQRAAADSRARGPRCVTATCGPAAQGRWSSSTVPVSAFQPRRGARGHARGDQPPLQHELLVSRRGSAGRRRRQDRAPRSGAAAASTCRRTHGSSSSRRSRSRTSRCRSSSSAASSRRSRRRRSGSQIMKFFNAQPSGIQAADDRGLGLAPARSRRSSLIAGVLALARPDDDLQRARRLGPPARLGGARRRSHMRPPRAFDYRRLLAPRTRHLCRHAARSCVAVHLVGHTALGARRWLSIGGFPLEPSELSKLLLVVVLAALLSRAETSFRGGSSAS